jgi:hypothetical protein
MVPFAGWVFTGGKWIKRAYSIYDKVSPNTKLIINAERKSTNAIWAKDVAKRWDDYLGPNTSSINPHTGKPDTERIFSGDGTRSIRFGSHEMKGEGTSVFHYHEETWSYDPVRNTLTVNNTLQRIK